MTGWIISSSVLILAVLLLRGLLKDRISPGLRYALWGLVLVRLLLPFQLGGSDLSVMNAAEQNALVRNAQTIQGVGMIEYTQGGTVIGSGRHEIMPDAPTVEIPHVSEEDFSQMKTLITARDILDPVWKGGIVVMLAVFLLSNSRFRETLRKTRTALEAPACPLPVYVSAAVETPCLFGLLQPAIYLPPEVAGEETLLRHALEHETTHFTHGDHLWAHLRCLCLALHWYNPLVWLAARCSRQDGELACDDGTIRRLGEAERTHYGNTLIDLTCEKPAGASWFCTATTMSGGKRDLRERITLIAKGSHRFWPATVLLVVTAAVAAVSTFTGPESKMEDPPPAARPADPTASVPGRGTFEDVLGFDGYWLQTELPDGRLQRIYYGWTATKYAPIARSFGPVIDDTARDLDGDGVTELVCNTTSEEGAERVLLYRREGDTVYLGSLDWYTLALNAGENWKTAEGDRKLERWSPEDGLLQTGYYQGGFFTIELNPLAVDKFTCMPYWSRKTGGEIPDEDLLRVAVKITGRAMAGDDYRYLTPADQTTWQTAWKTAMAAADPTRTSERTDQLGIWLVYQEEWWQLMASGSLGGVGRGHITPEDGKTLYDLALDLARENGWTDPVRPGDITGITSASLDRDGRMLFLRDPEDVKQIEAWLSRSEELYGGAACPFTDLLTLELDGERHLQIAMGTDSCSTWMSQGVCYQYPARDNAEFFDLFAPLEDIPPTEATELPVFTKADVEYVGQALLCEEDPLSYEERLAWLRAEPDYTEDLVPLGPVLGQASGPEGYLVYTAQWVGTPHKNAYVLRARFTDGTTAVLPLPLEDPVTPVLPEAMHLLEDRVVYEITFPEEVRTNDGLSLIHLAGTYHYEADLVGKTVSLTVLKEPAL